MNLQNEPIFKRIFTNWKSRFQFGNAFEFNQKLVLAADRNTVESVNNICLRRSIVFIEVKYGYTTFVNRRLAARIKKVVR
jgi:hypothetical protein